MIFQVYVLFNYITKVKSKNIENDLNSSVKYCTIRVKFMLPSEIFHFTTVKLCIQIDVLSFASNFKDFIMFLSSGVF